MDRIDRRMNIYRSPHLSLPCHLQQMSLFLPATVLALLCIYFSLCLSYAVLSALLVKLLFSIFPLLITCPANFIRLNFTTFLIRSRASPFNPFQSVLAARNARAMHDFPHKNQWKIFRIGPVTQPLPYDSRF